MSDWSLSAEWRCALLGALVAAPLVAATLLQSPNELALGPVTLGAAVAGYRYTGDDVRAVGRRLGALASVLGVPLAAEIVTAAAPATPQPMMLTFGVAMALVVVALVAALAIVAAVVGVLVGSWLADKTGRHAPAPA